MAWDSEMVTMVRYMINDFGTPQTYSDDTLMTMILISVQWVQQENTFINTYTTNIDNQTLTPDPTSSSARDESFMWLVSLKTACMLAQGELKKIGGQAIAITDEGSSIDLRGTLQGKIVVGKTFCDDYSAASWKYRLQKSPNGRGVFGPFSIVSNGLNGGYGWENYTVRDRALFL